MHEGPARDPHLNLPLPHPRAGSGPLGPLEGEIEGEKNGSGPFPGVSSLCLADCLAEEL